MLTLTRAQIVLGLIALVSALIVAYAAGYVSEEATPVDVHIIHTDAGSPGVQLHRDGEPVPMGDMTEGWVPTSPENFADFIPVPATVDAAPTETIES